MSTNQVRIYGNHYLVRVSNYLPTDQGLPIVQFIKSLCDPMLASSLNVLSFRGEFGDLIIEFRDADKTRNYQFLNRDEDVKKYGAVEEGDVFGRVDTDQDRFWFAAVSDLYQKLHDRQEQFGKVVTSCGVRFFGDMRDFSDSFTPDH